ncbi:MAG: ABC transporter ATP-binding protein, partial [Nocardiopsis sp. BM-2018]
LCDDINVLYAGRAVETAGRGPLFADPTHPYTVGLLGSIPRLDAPRGEPLTPVRGSVNDNIAWTDGCAFAPRCDHYTMECLQGPPPLVQVANGAGEGDDAGSAHVHRCVNPISHPEVVDRAVLESPAVAGDDEEERA